MDLLDLAANRIALRFAGIRVLSASALQDVSKLRFQAVFMMGAGGSGKGYVGKSRWLKYLPGGGAEPKYDAEAFKQDLTEQERGLTNLSFEKTVADLAKKGINLRLIEPGAAGLPFRLYSYDENGRSKEIPPSEWAESLPLAIHRQVEGLTEVVFRAPKAELPSYWRQVDPDLYKEELAGYMAKNPGYVHEMSSEMAKSYMDAVLRTGDPMFVDGTGSSLEGMKAKMDAAKRAGYKTSLVFVYVPLVVNQIRNLTRARNVSPMVILKQWQVLQQNYVALKGYADKAKIIINRNDPVDRKAYFKNAEGINQAIARETAFDSLYEFIAEYAPSELGDWGSFISPEKWR